MNHSTSQEQEKVASAPVAEPRILGLKKKTFFLVLALVTLLILGLALGAGLGIGLKKKKSKSENIVQDPFCATHAEYCIGGALNADYYSQKGAFNGSGIALAGESWTKGTRHLFQLFFQHHTGGLRRMAYGVDQKWDGGNASTTIATDVKNGSAISIVQYYEDFGLENCTAHIHLFYISQDNLMKQKIWSNETDKWDEGIVSGMNLAVYDVPSVGMQACWKGNSYGDAKDSDLNKFGNGVDKTIGINLWFPSDDSTFQQYVWYRNAEKWEKLSPWLGKNVYAGVGCYSWEDQSTTSYTMMVNNQNATEIWWKDSDTSLKSEDEHPINSWVNSENGTIPDVYPSTSIGYTNYLYMQMADKSIKGFNLNYTAEDTHSFEDVTITDPAGPVKGLGGTHLTCTSYALSETTGNTTTKLWDSLYIFYQTKGNDITAFTRPFAGGQWTAGNLIIPDE
ncbi:hypothetical protein K504DRAFT_485591 [Pleomassaria siparia CBS 279.74]|uniref:Fucose-specific lectin n=1 Tax=Pleomassaria siparia CBS 279.74 TaxID=1314801 RepID=A0A6G1JUB7_9PLEO|nr:hypothetical protein K504DRAFT_485591 [Pleomassaria siparia CBS 279.74]